MTLFENFDKLEPGEASYRMLKSERRSRRIALALKFAVAAFLYLYYQHLQLPQNAEEKQALIENAQSKIEAFVTPIVERTATNLTKKLQAQMEAEIAGAASNAVNRAKTAVIPKSSNAPSDAEIREAVEAAVNDPSKLDPATVKKLGELLERQP